MTQLLACNYRVIVMLCQKLKASSAFKTGSDFDFPVLLLDVQTVNGVEVETPVDIAAENLQFHCSIFDHKLKKLAIATVNPAGVITPENAHIRFVNVPAAVTATWLPCEDACFDIKAVNTVTGKVRYSLTVYFDIERGLS